MYRHGVVRPILGDGRTGAETDVDVLNVESFGDSLLCRNWLPPAVTDGQPPVSVLLRKFLVCE